MNFPAHLVKGRIFVLVGIQDVNFRQHRAKSILPIKIRPARDVKFLRLDERGELVKIFQRGRKIFRKAREDKNHLVERVPEQRLYLDLRNGTANKKFFVKSTVREIFPARQQKICVHPAPRKRLAVNPLRVIKINLQRCFACRDGRVEK